jgi:hypothetical protein
MAIHFMTTLHAWNSRIVPVLGLPLNTLLFWLIWIKTPKEMRVHSRILLQTCVVDIILLLISLIGIPVIYCYNILKVYEIFKIWMILPNHTEKTTFFDGFLLNSVLALFENERIFLLIYSLIVNCVILFDFYSLSVQFAYRYLVLNR